MRYLPIIPVLLDKVTCLTSALFLLLSFFGFFVGGEGGLVSAGGGAAHRCTYLFFFSAKYDARSRW